MRPSFTDPLLVTQVHLRLGIPHAALAAAFGVDRSTVARAIGQIRPLLARRGFATATRVRLRTLADVFAYAAAENVTLRMDGTEISAGSARAQVANIFRSIDRFLHFAARYLQS